MKVGYESGKGVVWVEARVQFEEGLKRTSGWYLAQRAAQAQW